MKKRPQSLSSEPVCQKCACLVVREDLPEGLPGNYEEVHLLLIIRGGSVEHYMRELVPAIRWLARRYGASIHLGSVVRHRTPEHGGNHG